jgi:Xaa-Pro aminopeptidase
VALREQLPGVRFVEAAEILEDLRAVKQPYELAIIRTAAERVVASMVATFERSYPDITTATIEQILREEETAVGLDFVYGQVMTGPDGHRFPSESRRWESGAALALDSGGALRGYLGDLSRMAILGEPSQLQRELLDEVDAIQMAARRAVRAGAAGRDIQAAVEPMIRASPNRDLIDFIGEGTGLVGHEAPRLMTSSPLPNPGRHNDEALQSGMVLGLETTLAHPKAGVIKLEDIVAVTDVGCEALGDAARGWTVLA